jgi:hypothetical protein
MTLDRHKTHCAAAESAQLSSLGTTIKYARRKDRALPVLAQMLTQEI